MEVVSEQRHEKKAWRGSLLMDFGSAVGESLNKLELEYDEMIVNFEQQKSRLKEFTPHESTIQEEATRAPSPALSNASSSHSDKRVGAGGSSLRSTLRNAQSTIKRKLSNRGSSSSQRTSPRVVKREPSEEVIRYDQSETSSINSEVFAKEEAVNGAVEEKKEDNMDYPLPMAYDQHQDSAGSSGSNRLSVTLTTKPPISPGKIGMRFRSSTVSGHDDHVITPPVVIDGEVKRDYQYVSPARRVGKSPKNDNKGGIFRSSSFAKILGRTENGSSGNRSRSSSKDESPLKALYKATVLSECNNKENQNNHNNNTAAILRMYKCTT
uniref:Uncharacterized protein LOC100176279 n=1 Tax=Phallusia mammillata TaxID=59560 RepID=A0A6F9DH49_9ASCI|nr:uncharacterized protein LOC100176279 [Phallusia mammillata]